MTIVTADLPANESYDVRIATLSLHESEGVMAFGVLVTMESNKGKKAKPKLTRYVLIELATGKLGRRFKLTKPKGSQGGPYHVLLSVFPKESACDCTGFEQYGGCKHLQAVKAFADQGLIPPGKKTDDKTGA